MNKIQQLYIRACKSQHPLQRVASVYRRFYLNTDEDISKDVAYILTNICDEHFKYRLSEMISDLNPHNNWRIDPVGDDTYWSRVVHVLISKIRLSEVPVDVRSPLRFRKVK